MIVLPASEGENVTRLFTSAPTLSGAVEGYLRDAIVKGEFSPGSPLREIELQDRLEVSNTPIRDALNALSEQGLVEIETNKRKRVSLLDAAKITDVVRVHLPIWKTAFRWAFDNVNEVQLSRLAWELDSCDYEIEHGRKAAAVEALLRFHEVILSACGSPEISRLLMSRQSLIARHILLQADDLIENDAVAVFRRMVNAISAKDAWSFSRYYSVIGAYLYRKVRTAARVAQEIGSEQSHRAGHFS